MLPASCYYKHSILASRLGAGGAAQGPVPGSRWTGAPSTCRFPRRAAFVGQKPLFHSHASRVAAQGSAAADHSMARDKDGHLENSGAATVRLGSRPVWSFGIQGKAPDHDGPRAQLAGLGHLQALVSALLTPWPLSILRGLGRGPTPEANVGHLLENPFMLRLGRRKLNFT